uniref:Gypsy retrotransposon integrase-like protein 1 n=1 Tax=Astyanax mexicanus TaxID=7994 RepID=A0A3B1K366_ASTMX
MSAPQFEHPKIDWDSADLYQEFERFRSHVTFVFDGPLSELTAKQRAGWLGTWIGEQGREIYKTLEWGDGEKEDPFKVLDKFSSYIRPRKNKRIARHRFKQRKQGASESFDHFVKDLRLLLMDCEYADPDDMLIDAIIAGVREKRVQERLLDKGEDLTLAKAVEIPQQFEMSQKQIKIVREEDTHVSSVSTRGKQCSSKQQYAPKQNKSAHQYKAFRNQQKTCSNCGKHPQHKWSQGKCPAKGSVCSYCHKPNHWAAVCRKRSVNALNVETAQNSPDDEILDINVMEATDLVAAAPADKWTVDVKILSQIVKFRIDTGAKCNTLTLNSYQLLLHPGELKSSTKVLRSYTNHKLKPVGAVDLTVKSKNCEVTAEFEVVDIMQENVLSGNTAEALGLIFRLDSLQTSTEMSMANKDRVDSKGQNMPVGLEDFPELVHTTGTLPGKYSIKIDPNAKGVVHPVRRQPEALKTKIVQKLHEMVGNGYITKVDQPTEWVSSMVAVVRNGNVRICIDPSDLNKVIKREHHPMRTIEEVASTIPGAKVFSVLDAKSGFLQIELDEASSFLTTFNTPIGRFRWLRLPFGVKCAPEIFQRIIDTMLEGIDGATGIMDDILVAAPTVEKHDAILRKVVERATNYNLRLNFNKCHIRQSSVPYVGHQITAEGLKPDPAKVEAVQCMPPPVDKDGVRRFLGFVTYLAKFIPNLSEVSAPLRQLLRSNVEFAWQPAQQQAFDKLKDFCSRPPVLKFFDPALPVEIFCDASSYGLGAVLLQEDQPVAFSSRSLTDTESRYAQIEKEMLSIVHACTKFHHYIFGKHVTVFNDHKPLEDIFKKSLLSTPMRIQRMRLRLQWYDITVKYRKGKDMELPDALSRAQLALSKPEMNDLECVSMISYVSVSDQKYAELQVRTKEELGPLTQIIQHGWPDHRREVPVPAQPYWDSRSQLAVLDGIVYKGLRIVVPPTMQGNMLKLIHQSHLGMVKSKQRAREVLYWPGMSAEIETIVKNCSKCAEFQNRLPRLPLKPTETPELPFEEVATDLFEFEGKNYILLVDYYSKFVEVDELKDTRSCTAIEALKAQFGRHGIPAILRSDNGPQYSSEEFSQFCNLYGIVHKTSSPYTPHSNGEAERAVQTVKKLWRKAPDKHLALLDYRTTPLESVGLSPAQMLMGRRPRSDKLPTARALLKPTGYDSGKVKQLLDKSKDAQKFYFDRKQATSLRAPLKPGDEVRMAPYPGSSKWTPGVIIQPHSAPRSYIVDSGGKKFRRNSQHLRASTAVANRSRHFVCDEPWTETSDLVNGRELQSPRTAPRETVPRFAGTPSHNQAHPDGQYHHQAWQSCEATREIKFVISQRL